MYRLLFFVVMWVMKRFSLLLLSKFLVSMFILVLVIFVVLTVVLESRVLLWNVLLCWLSYRMFFVVLLVT